MVEITTDNIFNIFKSKKFGYLGGSDFAVSDDGLTWSIIQHYTDLSLTNPSTALINGYYYIADDTGIRKTKDFNTFFDIDTKISDDKHSDLNNFEWFQDLNGSWFIKYNASTATGTFTYWADFDETTDSFVDPFNQFNMPNGGASGMSYVRGKYYLWQAGDKLYRADNFTDKFEQVKTDIAGNTNHKQFSSVVSDNYLYVYFTVDDKTYVRSSNATNLIHWSEPVEVDNVELGSYFYNHSAISVYPDHDKVTTFNKVLKVTANGFKQTVPISCMVLASLQVQWEQNSTYQISFTAFDDGSVSYTMLSEEAQVEFNGQNYIIKQAVEDASGGVDTKTITASHIYNEINRVRQRKTKTGTLTYSVQDVLSFYLDDKVANSFGFAWSVFGDFDKQQIENLGNSSGSDMLAKIVEHWPQAIIYPDNKLIRVYTPEAFAKDYGGRIDYLHNSSDVKMTVDSTTITNQVKVFGKQIENTSDNADDNAPIKYYFEPFIVSEQASINQYGLHPMDDISDERFTDKNAMQTFAKGQLSPNPAVSIEVTMEDNEIPYAGEKRHLIAKPLNLETDLTVIGYTWYPFDNAQKNSLSFANLPASILQTQANTNNRIRMVQLMAQQAINAAKTGTRNFVSPTDPMKNDSNDIRTGDIWTLPLLDKKTKSLVRSVNVESEDDSDTNETIYTDPEKMDKINVQFSIWNGSQWLELSNQRTTNKLNDNINSIASQVQEAQAGIATAVKNAQDAVDKADKAITDAGFATDTANTAKEVANGVKGDVADAKSDSANALQQAQDAMTNATDAKTTANSIKTDVDTVKGELTSKADKTDVDNLSGTVKTQGTAITQNAKDIESKASQSDVNTLTGRVETAESNITQNANSIKSKVSSSDVQGMLDNGGYATQSWTGSQIKQSADEINSTVTSVSNKVDNLQIGGRNLFLDSDFYLTSANASHSNMNLSVSLPELAGKTITLSFDVDVKNVKTVNDGNNYTRTLFELKLARTDGGFDYAGVAWDGFAVGDSYSGRITRTTIIPNNDYKDTTNIIEGVYTQGFTADSIKVGRPKLEFGNKATDWSPAPEDMATVTSLSKVDQKADSISTTVTNNKNDSDSKFTNINQTISGIQSTVKDKADSSTVTQLSNVVDSKVSTKDYNSEITQLANDINLRVKTDDLISQINLASDNVLIQSGNGKGTLYLDAGTVVFSGKPFIPSAAITEIDADKITVSDEFNVNNMFTVDSNGNMTSQSATISGEIGTGSIMSNFSNVKQDINSYMPWKWDAGTLTIGNGVINMNAKGEKQLIQGKDQWGSTQWVAGELSPSYLKITSYPQDPSTINPPKNLVPTTTSAWQQGTTIGVVGKSPSYDTSQKIVISMKSDTFIAFGANSFYQYRLPSPYYVDIQEYDKNKKYLRSTGWIRSMGSLNQGLTGDNTAYLILTIYSGSYKTNIAPSDIQNIDFVFYNNSDYDQSQTINGRMYLDANGLSMKSYNGNTYAILDSTGTLNMSGHLYTAGTVYSNAVQTNGIIDAHGNSIMEFPGDNDNNNINIHGNPKASGTFVTNGLINENGGYSNLTGSVAVGKNLSVKGTKNAVVPTSKGATLINAYETAEYYFGDLGEATTDNTGAVVIAIDSIFSETVNTRIAYHVFVSSYTDSNVWVTDRTETSFTVHSSKPNTDFSWEIKAKRLGYEDNRLETSPDVTWNNWDTYDEAKDAGASEAVLKTYIEKDTESGDTVDGTS